MAKTYKFTGSKQTDWIDEPGKYDVVITNVKLDYTQKGDDMMIVTFTTPEVKSINGKFFFTEAAQKRIDWLLTAAAAATPDQAGNEFEVNETSFRALLMEKGLTVTVGFERQTPEQKAAAEEKGYGPRLEVKRFDAIADDAQY